MKDGNKMCCAVGVPDRIRRGDGESGGLQWRDSGSALFDVSAQAGLIGAAGFFHGRNFMKVCHRCLSPLLCTFRNEAPLSDHRVTIRVTSRG